MYAEIQQVLLNFSTFYLFVKNQSGNQFHADLNC